VYNKTMADKITWSNEKRKLSELVPWERNPRQITDKQAKRLEESFEQFGQVEIIAIGPENQIYNGHQRLKVLSQKYGADYEVDVRVASRALTEKEREKLTVYLHKGAAGDWDFDVLANEFELDDLLNWGFEPKELDLDLWAGEPPEDVEPQIDKAEELREKWQVQTGQLWQLGAHRLICGDCTDKAVVERVMGGEKADIAVTDPPYGVLSDEWDRQFNQDDLDNLIANSTGLVAIFNSAKTEIIKAILHLEPMPERMGVWRHSQIAPKPGMIWSWQPLFYWRCGDAVAWDSLDWYQGNSDKDGTHPTQKPVEFFEKIISSVEGRSVYDPFLGSGTTLIACELLGRKCRAVEISPAYVAVAIQRWVDVTGKEPVLLES
jgi:DNA modification methylase